VTSPAIAELLNEKKSKRNQKAQPFDDELQHAVEQPSFQKPEDSFANLPMLATDTQKATVGQVAGEKNTADNILKMSMIQPDEATNSFFQNQSSFVFGNDDSEQHPMNKEGIDEYMDDDDPGFDTYVVNEENFVASCRELAAQNNFPARAIAPDSEDYAKKRDELKRVLREKEKVAAKALKKDDSAMLLQKL